MANQGVLVLALSLEPLLGTAPVQTPLYSDNSIAKVFYRYGSRHRLTAFVFRVLVSHVLLSRMLGTVLACICVEHIPKKALG